MDMSGGENILRRNQLVKMDWEQSSSNEKQVQIGKIKSMCFVLSNIQNRYSFLLKHLRYGDNVDMDDYPVTTTLSLDLLIRTEGGIQKN